MVSFDDKAEVVRGVSWAAFERRLQQKGDHVVPRLHYLDGVLEAVTPSRGHETAGSWIGRLIEVYALEAGVELSAVGSWTLKDELKRAGAEPDECYIVGPDPESKLERPHFAIEVQWSRHGVDKLEIYKRLDVREVWFWDRGSIVVYVRHGDAFRHARRSSFLPELDLELLCTFLDRDTMTAAMREFRAALQRRRRR
ncbi:MAG: Uma2 family endonuclease [Acidobacteriota bacterium]